MMEYILILVCFMVGAFFGALWMFFICYKDKHTYKKEKLKKRNNLVRRMNNWRIEKYKK